MIRNLEHVDFKEKNEIISAIDSYQENARDAYALSMPLLMAAWLGDKTRYDVLYSAMRTAMESNQLPAWVSPEMKPGVMAWLYGRMCVAAEALGKDTQAAEARGAALLIVNELSESTPPVSNEFTSWALSYIVMGLPADDYQKRRDEMIRNAQAVMDTYTIAALRIPPKSTAVEQVYLDAEKTARSNALWAWVMVVQAAAHQGDTKGYKTAWLRIADIAGIYHLRVLKMPLPTNHAEQLANTFPADQYRAWGFANLVEAAQHVEISFSVPRMKERTREVMRNSPLPQDKHLAQVIYALAEAQATQRPEPEKKSVTKLSRF